MDAKLQETGGESALTIGADLLAALLADARSDACRERCGLLLGQGGDVTAFRAAANVAADDSRHFEIDPAALIAAHRDARTGGDAVIGHYHSHPVGRAVPSATDAAMAAADGAVWLIVTATDARAWRAESGGDGAVRFVPVHLNVQARLGARSAA